MFHVLMEATLFLGLTISHEIFVQYKEGIFGDVEKGLPFVVASLIYLFLPLIVNAYTLLTVFVSSFGD